MSEINNNIILYDTINSMTYVNRFFKWYNHLKNLFIYIIKLSKFY